jgi:hypothetical protein
VQRHLGGHSRQRLHQEVSGTYTGFVRAERMLDCDKVRNGCHGGIAEAGATGALWTWKSLPVDYRFNGYKRRRLGHRNRS